MQETYATFLKEIKSFIADQSLKEKTFSVELAETAKRFNLTKNGTQDPYFCCKIDSLDQDMTINIPYVCVLDDFDIVSKALTQWTRFAPEPNSSTYTPFNALVVEITAFVGQSFYQMNGSSEYQGRSFMLRGFTISLDSMNEFDIKFNNEIIFSCHYDVAEDFPNSYIPWSAAIAILSYESIGKKQGIWS